MRLSSRAGRTDVTSRKTVILAAQRIQAGALEGLAGAEELAKTGLPEGKLVLVAAKQGLQQVGNQIADLSEQLAILLDMPLHALRDAGTAPAGRPGGVCR